MRHYTVFLSEDSSDDEFQQEEDPVCGFSENFFFSAPFEWSILYSFIVLIQSSNNGFALVRVPAPLLGILEMLLQSLCGA